MSKETEKKETEINHHGRLLMLCRWKEKSEGLGQRLFGFLLPPCALLAMGILALRQLHPSISFLQPAMFAIMSCCLPFDR